MLAPTPSAVSNTRERLLEAAAAVFMEAGFRKATFREICQRAGANNAAINYYFRDKESLYLEVIHRAIDEMEELFPRVEVDDVARPEENLRAFVRSILTRLLGVGGPTRLMKLMSHEMIEPSVGLEVVVQKVIEPLVANLDKIVRQLVGPAASQQQVQDSGRSILAQCQIYDHGRAVIARLGHYQAYDAATIEHLVDHVTRFSLGGIRALAAS
jgi:TetR/AcrR family transcriptional regulator, regulator of cefoperazone and chloramphenicol sensitivity